MKPRKLVLGLASFAGLISLPFWLFHRQSRLELGVNGQSLLKAPVLASSAPEDSAKTTAGDRAKVELAPVASVYSPAESIQRFDDWTQRYQAATTTEAKQALVDEGRQLAEERRPAFQDLIKTDPRQAIEKAVPMVVRQKLPSDIVALLEERVSGRGAIRVYQGVGIDNASPVTTVRMVDMNQGTTYQGYVYGRRAEKVAWTASASVNGVAIGSDLAVNEDPIRPLEVGELPDASKPIVSNCPVSGNQVLDEKEVAEAAETPITEETPAIEANGEIIYLCNGSHTVVYREALIYAEAGTGGATTFTGLLPAAPTPSIGNIKVLVIPMTFADQNDTPSTESVLYNLMREVGDHYAKASYGKLTLATTVTPPIKVPHNEAWYIQKDTSNGGNIDGLGKEHSDARAEARKLGFDDSNYDCVVVRLKGGARPAGGWGGGSSVWIYGDGVSVTAHEIGHSFGLAHANFWDTSGTSSIGLGANDEYGGHWDVMGGVGVPNGHYNVRGKSQIKWLPPENTTPVTESGLYRIYAQDQAILQPDRRHALVIKKDTLRTYWGELRAVWTGATDRTWADYGLILGWHYPNAGGSNWQLIDTTPGSPFGKDDSPISLGQTFSDTEAGIHITTLGTTPASGTTPKSVEVMVNLGSFPTNRAPTLALAASTLVVPINKEVSFTATASDPDGDTLAFNWQHFGDSNYRTISPNAPSFARSFATAGTYVVTCTVSDMKGGAAIRSVLITVGNGNSRSTISGRVTLGGQAVAGVSVLANGANGVITDSDGRYTIPNLSSATYTLTASRNGYTFTELFNNSIAVSPSFTGADFDAGLTPRLTVTTTTASTAEGSPTPAVLTLTRTGDASQAMTVLVSSPSGTATTADITSIPALGSGQQGFSSFTIPAGELSLNVAITAVNDTAAEGPETLTYSIAPGSGYLISGNASATFTIDDNDTTLPKLSVVATTPKTTENGPTSGQFTITRTGSTSTSLTVPITLSGSANAGSDYVPVTATVTIPATQASVDVSIHSINDATSESLETVVLTLPSNALYVLEPTASSATISIVDDDFQVVSVVASDAVATEVNLSTPGTAADTATFLITREGDNSQPLTVYYAVAGIITGSTVTALHGVDYEPLPGLVVIPAGKNAAVVPIIPILDGIGESPESVTLQLGAGPTNYTLSAANATSVTINDGGDKPYVEVIGVDNATEGSSPTLGRFRFSMKSASASSVTVAYTITGTATSGSDFTALSGTVSIAGGGINTTEVTVTPVNDSSAEDLETVTLTITPNPSVYGLFQPSSSATIWLYDDEQPTVFVDASDSDNPAAFSENGSGGPFYVSRTGSTTAALTVNYAMSGSGINGTDYTAVTGSVVIPAGAKGADIQITPINDTIFEGQETIVCTLAAGAYGTGEPAVYIINDNDTATGTAQFTSAGSAVLENAGTVNVPVSLTGSPVYPVTVDYSVDTGARAITTESGTASVLPYWVRTVRSGASLTGFVSPDGTNWTQVASNMVTGSTSSYLVGLHVCSYNTGTLSTATFDNVTVTGLQAGGTQGALTRLNVGTTATAGSHSVNAGVYTVSGAGDNVDGTTDQGYFAYWAINNSTTCTITARVLSQTNTNAGAVAGTMIRTVTANTSQRGYMAATPGQGFEYHNRDASSGAAAKTAFAPSAQPFWLKLQRTGSVFSASQSYDGTAWTPVGTNRSVSFGPDVIIGLAVSSQDDAAPITATFDNVSLTPTPAGGLALSGGTFGFTDVQGTSTYNGSAYTIMAAGDGINGTTDDGFMAQQWVNGDFTFIARVASSPTGSTPQAGLMVRESNFRQSRMVFLDGSAGGAPQLLSRNSTVTTAYGASVDHSLAEGKLTFTSPTTLANIVVPITNDTLPEAEEVLMISLKQPLGVGLGTQTQHALTIVDDDVPPAQSYVGFAAPSSTALENVSPATLLLSLSKPSVATLTVNYSIAAGSATAGSDFTAGSGTVTFAAGEMVQTLPVSLINDSVVENPETITVTLSSPSGGALGSLITHTLTISDDDKPVVTLSSDDPTATEAAGAGRTATVTATRTGAITSSLTVSLLLSGTATITTDYSLANTITIPIGASSASVTLTSVSDSVSEGTETVTATLASNAAYTIGTPNDVSLEILDDDRNTVTITTAQTQISEGSSATTITVSRTGSTAAALSVPISRSGTAANTTDYTTNPSSMSTFSLAAGQASRTITLSPVNDTTIESDEVVILQIDPGTYEIAGAGYIAVTITDNDVPPTIFITSPTAEGTVISPTNGLALTATMTDDGLPNVATATWSQLSGPGVVTFNPTSSTTGSTAATFATPGTYVLRVTASDGLYTAFDQISVNVAATSALQPAEWLGLDVGPPTARGITTRNAAGDFTLVAAGTGYASTSDRAHTSVRQVTGNATMIAKLTSIGSIAETEAGLTIRDSMHRYARRAALLYQRSTNTLRFRTRTTANSNDTSVSATVSTFPLWLKLDRVASSDTIAAYYASDVGGSPGTWTAIGSPTAVTMDDTADVGLTAFSASDTVTTAATFTNVSLTPTPSGTASLIEDYGYGTQTGTYSYDAGTDRHVLNGQPGSMESNGQFYGQQVTGDFVLTVLQLDATSGADTALSGLIIRDCMDDGPMVFLGRNPFSAYGCYIWRTNPKGGTDSVNGITQKTRWFRLIRRGNQITGLHAPDSGGTPGSWTQLGQPQTVFLRPSVLVGLAVNNGAGTGLNTATFTKLSVVSLNNAPIVDAGVAPSNPTSPLALVGTASDDGAPNSTLATLWTDITAPSAVVFAQPSALSTSATFGAPGAYLLRLSASDGLATTFDDLAFTVTSSPFTTWQTQNFAGGASNPNAAATADPDGDGLTNLYEYALNLSPTVGNGHALNSSTTTVGADSFVRLVIAKNPSASDVTVSVQKSTTLLNTSWIGSGLIIEQNTASSLMVRSTSPINATQREYFRIVVTQP